MSDGLREALKGLVAKWRALHSDDGRSCVCEKDCADELEAALAAPAEAGNGLEREIKRLKRQVVGLQEKIQRLVQSLRVARKVRP